MKKYVNSELVDMTEEDIAEQNVMSENITTMIETEKVVADKKATDKANAKAKLQAAEYTPLTEDEAQTIVL